MRSFRHHSPNMEEQPLPNGSTCALDSYFAPFKGVSTSFLVLFSSLHLESRLFVSLCVTRDTRKRPLCGSNAKQATGLDLCIRCYVSSIVIINSISPVTLRYPIGEFARHLRFAPLT